MLEAIKKWWNKFESAWDETESLFPVDFYCKNCYARQKHWFPVGSLISRAPYLGYPNTETTVFIPHKDDSGERVVVKCNVCKVGNVA